jgi:hypothetical protein
LTLNIGIIALRGEVKSEEHGPNYQEWPNVGMQLERKRVMQGRILDLGVICEFCPVYCSASMNVLLIRATGTQWGAKTHILATG